MTPSRRAYIQRALLLVSAAGERAPTGISPEASAAVGAFRSCGWDVVVLGGSSGSGRASALDVTWRSDVEGRDPGAWLLTNEVTDNHWARPLGMKTALIGPVVVDQSGPARCDVAFRDLRTAALEILASDVPITTTAVSS